jgi:hypothetical protein
VRSARRHPAGIALLGACAALLVGALGGCATTQDTAALKQAESKRILEARKHRQKHRRQSKSHDQGGNKR